MSSTLFYTPETHNNTKKSGNLAIVPIRCYSVIHSPHLTIYLSSSPESRGTTCRIRVTSPVCGNQVQYPALRPVL